jgi:hypothetical protein
MIKISQLASLARPALVQANQFHNKIKFNILIGPFG